MADGDHGGHPTGGIGQSFPGCGNGEEAEPHGQPTGGNLRSFRGVVSGEDEHRVVTGGGNGRPSPGLGTGGGDEANRAQATGVNGAFAPPRNISHGRPPSVHSYATGSFQANPPLQAGGRPSPLFPAAGSSPRFPSLATGAPRTGTTAVGRTSAVVRTGLGTAARSFSPGPAQTGATAAGRTGTTGVPRPASFVGAGSRMAARTGSPVLPRVDVPFPAGAGSPTSSFAPSRAVVDQADGPSAHVGDDMTDPSLATWCDEYTKIVCEIFADEVLIGNRSSTHLNKAGYQNVIQKFKERTGVVYKRKQFKNKWDRLKIDYGIWKQLTRQTGLGWDASGKNIDMHGNSM